MSNSHLHDLDLESLVDVRTPVRSSAQRLRNTLRLNTTTSLVGGLAAAAAGAPMARLLGVDDVGWVRLAGLGLCLFAGVVLTVAGARTARLLRYAPVITVGDAGWVTASVVTIALGWYSTSGAAVIAVVAAVVAALAVGQVMGVRRTRQLLRSVPTGIDEDPRSK